MRSSFLLPRAVRWMLLATALMLFMVVMPAVKASKPQAHASRELANQARTAEPDQSLAPAIGRMSPATDFRPQSKATVTLPSQSYGLAVDTDEIAYSLQPLTINRQQLTPEQIGIGRKTEFFSVTQGRIKQNPDGSTLRVMAIKSPGAEGLRVHLQDVNLAPGDQIFIYSKEADGLVEGPYTGKGPFKDGQFWSSRVDGDTAIIEYYMKGDEHPFRIGEVSHIFTRLSAKDIQPNAITPNVLSCHQDAMCVDVPEKNSVGRMEFIDGGDSFVCTGSMITDRAADFKPYFMTASHCISSEASAQSLILYWFYHTTACNSGILSTGIGSSLGATLLATDSSSDSTLLKITGSVPGGIMYSGWSPSPISGGANVFSLNHPGGGTPPSLSSYLRYATGSVIDTSEGCEDSGLLHGYLTQWDMGATEPGSSGSGLWINDGGQDLLVGVLSCGPQENCNRHNTLQGLYGKFADFYPLAKPFLDPTISGCISTSIIVGQGVSGELTGSDCQGKKGFADLYTFNGTAGQQVAISLTSSAFDSYVYLLDPNNNVIAEDDDSGGGNNARIPASGFFTLPASGLYTIEVDSASGTGTGGYNLSLTAPGACIFTTNPISQSFPESGGSGNFAINTGSDCNWTAASNASWLLITSATSGKGNGTITYTVAPNTDVTRTGTITVGGQNFIVTQAAAHLKLAVDDGTFENALGLTAGGTDYAVNRLTPASYPAQISQVAIYWPNFNGPPPIGQTFDILVGVNPTGNSAINSIAFQTTSATVKTIGQFNVYDVPPVTITSGDFVVGFRMTYTRGIHPTALDESPSHQRSYLSSDGITFFLTDGISFAGNFGIRATLNDLPPAPCTYAIAPQSLSFPVNGGTGSITVTTGGNCDWSATSNDSFITITSAASGTGTGSVTYSVAPNAGDARSGTMNIAGQIFSVSQARSGPEITTAVVSGKQLQIFGHDFAAGAQIFVDGVKQKKVFNDTANPTTMVFAKKAGKQIAHGQTVDLQVVNLDGRATQHFSFTRP